MSFARGFLISGLVIYGGFWSWDRGVTQDGISRYLEKNPRVWRGDLALRFLAGHHELFNREERALAVYRQLQRIYPKSSLVGDAVYGEAATLERLRRWDEAKEVYIRYIEEYPNGQYAASVRKNIEFLKTR